MPSSDWMRVDNLEFVPNPEFSKSITDYSLKIQQGLEGSMNSAVPKTGGSKKKACYKQDSKSKKVKINGRLHCIWLGPRGGKYVKVNGEYKPLRAFQN